MKNKILTPKHIKYDFNKKNKNITSQIQKKLKFPVVIKPINEGSSLGVYICDNILEFNKNYEINTCCTIDINKKIDSLNISNSAAIVFHHLNNLKKC